MPQATTTLPQTGTWEIDPAHSTIDFVVRHLGFSNVRGRFGEFTGSITIGATPEQSAAAGTIQVASIDTRDSRRDDHLRGNDFFDVEKFPTATFESASITAMSDGTFTATGSLSIHGISKTVALAVEFHGVGTDPWGGNRLGLSAKTEINREEFGLTWNQVLEAGSFVVGKKVKLEIEIEAVLKA